MREIKFKVWCKQTEEMHSVEEMGFNENGLRYVDCGDSGLRSCYFTSVDDWVLMQYTGLKDKNGKEIYEGDILSYEVMGESFFGKVIFENGSWHVHWKDDDDLDWQQYLFDALYKSEIVSNVYENPELIGDYNE